MQKQENSWRHFQSENMLRQKRIKFLFTALKNCILAVLVFILCLLIFKSDFSFKIKKEPPVPENKIDSDLEPAPDTEQPGLTRPQLSSIISKLDFLNNGSNTFFVDTPEESYKITTGIDPQLQDFLTSKIEPLKDLSRGKPQRIAIVVMEADTGKILAMAGFDLENPDSNPCLSSDYPAASIIKIVTASAAVESLNYNPGTQLYFNGNKYTLYKRQLKDVRNKYTYKVSFSKAFAESINPVFGKIGKNYLGREKLAEYADSFGFNRTIEFELPLESGRFTSDGTEYHIAELGCGFNHDTTISPVFGAMIVSAIVNSGRSMKPFFVEHITDSDGNIVYQNRQEEYLKPITPETSASMIKLMEKTISAGTAQKTFRGYSKDKVLSRLVIGGKTGSLYNKEHTVKYDWFTGFGKEKESERAISLSIVVGHRKYIGIRAPAYAKMILKHYFKSS